MPDTTFAPSPVITNRNRLWRVDAHEGSKVQPCSAIFSSVQTLQRG